jgi:hypothetical protein
MLLRNLRPDVRKLMRDGKQATGIVLAVRDWPAGTIGVSRFTLTIEAQLPGDKRTVKRYCDSHEFQGATPAPGDKLPLRYDADDHAKIEIDYEAFRRRQKTESDRLDAERLRDALEH